MKLLWQRVVLASVCLCSLTMCASDPKITITTTGSTNTLGMGVTLDGTPNAHIQPQGETAKPIKLSSSAVAEFAKNVAAAGPLHALPANHCMKSISFGSSLFISRGADRSPDLSCPEQSDPKTAALKKQAEDILLAAQKAGNVSSLRRIIE